MAPDLIGAFGKAENIPMQRSPNSPKAITIREQLNLLRQLTWIAAILFMGWGLITNYFEQTDFEVWPVRIGVTGLFLALWGWTRYRPISLIAYEWCMSMIGWIVIAYIFFVGWRQGLHPTWVIGSALTITGFLSVMTQTGPAVAFSAAATLVSVMTLWYPHADAKMSVSSVIVNYCLAVFLGLYSFVQRKQFLRQVLGFESNQDTILANMHEGVFLRDRNGTILLMNDAAAEIVGTPAEAAVGKSHNEIKWDVLQEDGVTLRPDEFPSSTAMRTGRPVVGKIIQHVRTDGRTALLAVSAMPIFGPDEKEPKSVVVTFRDITEMKKDKDTIETQRESLMVASRLSALGEMAAGIAHEINNPLAIIMARTDLLEKQIASGRQSKEELSKGIERIRVTAERVAKIVKSMKSLSRQRAGDDFQRSNLRELVEEVLEISKEGMREHSITIELNVPPDIYFDCHPGPIGQVFLNLFSNAVDALKSLDVRWITVDAHVVGEKIEISVTDSGQGVPRPIREKIMQPFFTTKEVGHGTGLGLSLVQNIVTTHGGSFRLDANHPNTRFIVELPLVQQGAVTTNRLAS